MGERLLHTQEATGSKPVSPTTSSVLELGYLLLLNVQRVKRSNIPDTQYNVVTFFTALSGCASLSLKVYSMVKSSVSLLVNELSAILVVL